MTDFIATLDTVIRTGRSCMSSSTHPLGAAATGELS